MSSHKYNKCHLSESYLIPIYNNNMEKINRQMYEVVFYVNYGRLGRPTKSQISEYFRTYGEVDKVVLPINKSYAFVYICYLYTRACNNRISSMLSRIIREIGCYKFYINVAKSTKYFIRY